MAVNTTQGVVLAIFGANAGGHLTALDANATANGLASLATDLSAAAGLILGQDLSSDAAFTSTVLGNLGIEEGSAGYTLASNYFTTNLAAGAGRGDLVAAAVTYLLGSSVDASLATAATAFSANVTAGVQYSQGEGSSVFGVGALQAAAGNASTATGQSFELTTGDDTLSGTVGTDTFSGTTAQLSADDRILDSTTTDNDVFNLTATTDPVAMDVTNVENININWDSYGTADIDLDNVSGATVTLTSAKSGYMGNANFTNVGENGVTVGEGIDGAVTVDAIEDAAINATVAESIVVTNADGNVTINAGAAETVTIAGADDAIIVATSGTDVQFTGGGDSAAITLGDDADITLQGAADATYTLTSETDIAVELQTSYTGEAITTAGAGAIEITFADGDEADGETVTNANGAVKLAGAMAAGADLSEVSATKIEFESTSGATTHSFADAANVVAEADFGAAVTIATTAATDAAANTITFTAETDQGANISFAGATNRDFETVNLVIDETPVSGTDVTLAEITLANDGNLVVTSAENDLEITAVTAGDVNLEGVAGDVTINQKAGAAYNMVIAGSATGDNTVAFTADDEESTYIGGSGDDDVTFATDAGVAAAMVGAGNNTVTANSVADGNLIVEAGDGNDTVSATGLTTAEVSLILGGGDNDVTLDGVPASGLELTLTTGNGEDEVTFTAGFTTVAGTTIAVDLGDGSDTITFGSGSASDFSAGTVTFAGVDIMEFGAGASNITLNADHLAGQSYTLKGAGNVTASDLLKVAADNNGGTYDFSGLSIDGTIAKAMAGLNFTGGSKADVVTGTDGGDTFSLGSGDDTVTAGLGADTITVGGGEDTIILGTKASTQNSSFATNNADASNFENVVDFTTADDVIQLSSAANAYGTGLTFSTDATVNVIDLGTMTGANYATLNDFIAAVATAATEVKSSSNAVYIYTAAVTSDTGTTGDFDTDAAGTYLFINDGTTALTIDDTIIQIGITGTLDATNFTIV